MKRKRAKMKKGIVCLVILLILMSLVPSTAVSEDVSDRSIDLQDNYDLSPEMKRGDNFIPKAEVPTYEFLTYANFGSDNSGYTRGHGVGGYSDKLYVAVNGNCYVYSVTIPAGEDPDMHPNNPEDPGPMATRSLSLIEIYNFGADCGWYGGHHAEFYIDENHIYYGPDNYGVGGIEKWAKNIDGTFGTYLGRVKDKDGNPIPVPPTNGETFTYDPTANTWYTCTRERAVYSFDMAVDTSWQYEFKYPSYEGGHHDGLEFVNGFLWISDMTTNWIGQWRKNPDESWEEIARFYYDNPVEDEVEGMGFGPLGHLWVTGWNRLYEIGGKELGEVIKGIELAMTLDKTVYDPEEIMDIHLKITDKEECCTFPISMNEVDIKMVDIKIADKYVNIEDGRIDKAIAWAENREGSHDYDGYSWRFVAHAYKKQAGVGWTLPRQGSAKQAANSLEPLKMGAPPRGALAFYDSVAAPVGGHVGLSLGDTDNDGKTEIIHAYCEQTGVFISDDYDNIGGCTYIGWTWPPIKIIYANKEYLIKAKAPSENGDHTVWVQVVTKLGSASDSKSFSVSGEVPSGTVSVSLIGNVDDATKDWKFPTNYKDAVFRRGIDNPTFKLTLDNQLSASYEGLFEVSYSSNDANTPIGSCKSTMCLISNDGFGSIWRWTDTNGNPLNKDQIPVGIYTVKGSLVNINDPSDKKEIDSCEFGVIFDFERMDDGAFTTRCNSGFKRLGYLPKELHQYDPLIWGRAIDWTSGSTTVHDAIDKLGVLTRTINGDSTYHHLCDNERTNFSHDGYDNNFNGIIDDDEENWDHQYEPYMNFGFFPQIYIKDLTTFFKGFRVMTAWLCEDDEGIYYKTYNPLDTRKVGGSNYKDVLSFFYSDLRLYTHKPEKDALEPRLESGHKYPVGVCEDYAMLSTAYLRSAGIPTKMVSGLRSPIAGGHAWTLYYSDGDWHHLDTGHIANKSEWERYRYDKRYYLTEKIDFLDPVYTEKYENEEIKKEDITNLYKPNLDVEILSYNPGSKELKIKVEYPSEYDSGLEFVDDYRVYFKVEKHVGIVEIEPENDHYGSIQISPGETKEAIFTASTSISPLDIIRAEAYVYVEIPPERKLQLGQIPIGTSPWTPASSIWQAVHSASMQTLENKHTTQIETINETINCGIVNMAEFKPGRTSPVTVSINNTGDQNATINIAFGMQTAEPVIGVTPTAILVGNKSAIDIDGHTVKEVPINVSVPNYFSPGLYKLILAPYNDTGILYMRNYTVNITANYDINISKPENVTIGIPFDLSVSIKNNDTEPICNITTMLNLHYYFNTTEPLAKDISQLNPGETHTFTWNLTPIDYGDLGLDVMVYSDSGCEMKPIDIKSLQTAKLWITPQVPEKVEKGDDFLLNATAYNSGDIPSDTVTVNLTLPENVTANRTSVVIGTIGAHENKTCIFRISQNKSEDFVILMNATATNVTATNYAFVNIIQPNMWIDILKGDETLGIEQHIGVIETLADEPCNLTVYIRNTGDENLSDVQILTNVGVTKEVGDINEGESRQVPIEFTPTTPGLNWLNVTVKADEIERNMTRTLLIEKFDFTVSIPKTQYDQNEPVPINISITNEVPNMRFIDAKIEINISNSNFNQTFKIPLLSLGPMVTKNTTFTWDTTGVNNGAYTIVTSLVIAEQEVLSDEKNVRIGLTPPIANANGPYTGVIRYIAVPITFDGTGSYDPDGTITSYEWDLDDDGDYDDAFGATPTVSFTAPHSGNIHLKVTDNNGATDTDTTTLTITKHSPPPNGHGGLLTPPEQPQYYCGTSTIQGKGYFYIDEIIQDWATAIDSTEHIEGTGEFEMASKKVLDQAANTSNPYDPNFYHKKTMQFQGNATNRLINREKFESSGLFGGTGTRINEYFDVSMIQKDESSSIKTISAPGSVQSHRFATMDDFSGIWGIDSDWQKICQKKIAHRQMFAGNFSVQKDLTFEREVIAP